MNIPIIELEQQIDKWANFLNSYVAPIGFSMGIGCLSLQRPRDYAFICMSFLALVVLTGGKEYLSIIMNLRKKQRTAEEDIIYRGIMSRYFNLKTSVTTFSAFWVAGLFLAMIFSGILKN